ncbi:hypothetical protein ACJX0J_036253, partial [Zea mays]
IGLYDHVFQRKKITIIRDWTCRDVWDILFSNAIHCFLEILDRGLCLPEWNFKEILNGNHFSKEKMRTSTQGTEKMVHTVLCSFVFSDFEQEIKNRMFTRKTYSKQYQIDLVPLSRKKQSMETAKKSIHDKNPNGAIVNFSLDHMIGI